MKRKYKCENCGFSFKSEKDVVKCPYCDKNSLVLDMKDEEALTSIDEFLK